MTGFTVEWLRDAENELADIYLQSQDRKAVTHAQAEIDRKLGTDPLHFG